MTLSERMVAATCATVLVTALVISGLGVWLEGVPGRSAAQALGAAFCFGLAVWWTRAQVLDPVREQVAGLVQRVRVDEPRDGVVLDPSFVTLAEALRGRQREIEAAAQQNARDTRMVNEVLDTSPFGTALVDAEGRITAVNPTFRSLFRLRGEPVGKRPIEVVPVVEVHEVVEVALAGLAAEKAFATATQDLVARAQPLSEGRAIVRVEDVTGIREAERARTDFVANVSHELRTPIAAIMGYLETILADRERVPKDVLPLLETVERNATRLRDLFEDLLKLHRIEARRRELPLERCVLRSLIEDAVGPTRDRAHMRRQELHVSCPPDLDAWVNPEAFTSILGNLVSNASAYSTEGAKIEVRAIHDGRGVRVEVQDDGIGIAERHHERIFERFYRVDEGRSRRSGGTGLGLAIVKHYALASRCNVTLHSREGEGSTFTIHLPASGA